MTDIVKRLRAIDHSSIEDCFMQSPLFETAADEITHLRAEVERLREVEAEFWSQNDALGKALLDNKQLKAALADVHAAAGNNHLIANIARAALEEKS